MAYWTEFEGALATCSSITGFTAPASPTSPYVYFIGAAELEINIDPWTLTQTPNTCIY